MKNKQHQYILKAFIESKIPTIIHRESFELIAIDSLIGGYCTQLIKKEKCIQLPSNEVISKDDKAIFSKLINQAEGIEKDELVIYYRLLILVESIIMQYKQ